MRRYLSGTILVAVVSLLIFWAPFWLNIPSIWGISLPDPSLKTIVANYDGLNFLVVARSWYDPVTIEQEYSALVGERGSRYFAAHYPVYPALIWLFDQFTRGDWAILLSIVVSNILLAGTLYYFFATTTSKKKWAMLLSLVALFFPARMLEVRSVGSNEPLFIALLLLSLIAYTKNRHYLAGGVGAIAVLTRSPGILLFLAYATTILLGGGSWREKMRQLLPYTLMPLGLIMLWAYFGLTYGDPLAYFKVGGNINLSWPPFLVFGTDNDWVSGNWLEDLVFTYAFYLGGIKLLATRESGSEARIMVNFGWIYLIATWFVVHRDIARYSLPLLPLALLGYAKNLQFDQNSRILLILLIPIYLVSWGFVATNVQPIADWAPFL